MNFWKTLPALLTLFLLVASCGFGCINGQSTATVNEEGYGNASGSVDVVSTNSLRSVSEAVKPFIKYNHSIIALINCSLLDGTGSSMKHGQTILIEEGTFTAVGDQASIPIPKEAFQIDLTGKTLIPGIVGVHNHLHIPGFHFVGEVATKLYLACGVTTIQTCGAAMPAAEVALAHQIAAGEKIGPEVITSGPYITGSGGNRGMVHPRDEQHLRDTMQYWIDQGVDWFKVYRHTEPDHLQIVLDVAHKNGKKVSGHFCSITFEEAINFGIDGIEHGLNSASDFRSAKQYGSCGGGREYMDELQISSDEVRRLHQLMINKNVFLTSTLSVYESGVANRAYADERTLAAMSPYLISRYEEDWKGPDQSASNKYTVLDSTKERRLKRIMAFDRQFFEMGGLLGAGVDAGRHNLFGFGDQRNFELLIEAGFSLEEALMVMTSNGAKILGRQDIGAITVGKRADCVILSGNLVDSVAAIERVETVFKDGLGYDSPLLLEDCKGKVGLVTD